MMDNIQLKSSLSAWFQEIAKEYENPFFGTLTFPYKKISKERASRQLEILKNKISKAIFNNAFKRYGKSVNWVLSIEGEDYNRHVHLAVDLPYANKLDKIFYPAIDGKYRLKPKLWKHGISLFEQYNHEKSGADYITKLKTKTGNYIDNFPFELM